MTTTILFIRNVPAELKRRYKSVCNLKGSSMQADIIKYMEEQIKKGEGQKKTVPKGKK